MHAHACTHTVACSHTYILSVLIFKVHFYNVLFVLGSILETFSWVAVRALPPFWDMGPVLHVGEPHYSE